MEFCGQLDFFMQGYRAALKDCFNKTLDAKDLYDFKDMLFRIILEKENKVSKLDDVSGG